MNLKKLAEIFNQAVFNSFNMRKFLVLFFLLASAGIVFFCFQIIAVYAPKWLVFPLGGIGLFFAVGFILAGGTLAIRMYIQEKNGEKPLLRHIVLQSWETLLKASYLALPLLMAFLLFWLFLGVFLLLKALPYIGPILGIILAFGPFLLNLATILLFLAAILLFFFAVPQIAMTGKLNRHEFLSRIHTDIFTHLLLLVVALFPVWVFWKFLSSAAWITYKLYSIGDNPLMFVLQNFFIILPFAAILTPVVIFFFNFAYEAYQYKPSEKE